MDWVLGYFAIGLMLLVVGRVGVALYYRLRPKRWVDDVMAAARSELIAPEQSRREFWKTLGQGAVIVALWPAAIVALVVQPRDTRFSERKQPEFSCKKTDLIEVVRPGEAEAAEVIKDPLGRVPDLPFGHLYTGWLELKAQLRMGDEIWRFKTGGREFGPSDANDGKEPGVVHGYAIVRRRKVVAEFVTQGDDAA